MAIPQECLRTHELPLPSVFSYDGGKVVASIFTQRSLFAQKYQEFDQEMRDGEGRSWRVTRHGVNQVPYNFVLCHCVISRLEGSATRQIAVAVGRTQPIFSVHDYREIAVPFGAIQYRFSGTFDEEMKRDASALPTHVSSEVHLYPDHFTVDITGKDGIKYSLFQQDSPGTIGVDTFYEDGHNNIRRGTRDEAMLFTQSMKHIGTRDLSLVEAARLGADNTNWPQWSSPWE